MAAAGAGRNGWPLSFPEEKRVSNGGVSYRVLKPWVHMVRFGFLAVVVVLSLVAGFSLVNIFYPCCGSSRCRLLDRNRLAGALRCGPAAPHQAPLVCYICPVGAALFSPWRGPAFSDIYRPG